MARQIGIGLLVWLGITAAGFLWGMFGGLFVFHNWAWPWEWSVDHRFVGAAWALFIAPIGALCWLGANE